MVYRSNRVSKGNGLKVFFTVAICSIVGIGIFSFITNPPTLETEPVRATITYTAQNTQSQEQSVSDHSMISQQNTNPSSNIISPANIGDLEQQIHVQINSFRTQSGLKPLVFDQKVADIARQHSQDMAVNNYFDHNSLDGKTVQNRFFNANYPCNPGENIEQTFVGDTPSSIVQSWLDSTEHRSNIMQNMYQSEGIGVYINNNGVFVTEDFC